jgi:hypothetical protein
MAQAVSCWPITMEARVHTWVSPCGIVVDKVVLGQIFLSKLFGFPLSISIHHCCILISHCPIRCAIALTKQHIITPSTLS